METASRLKYVNCPSDDHYFCGFSRRPAPPLDFPSDVPLVCSFDVPLVFLWIFLWMFLWIFPFDFRLNFPLDCPLDFPSDFPLDFLLDFPLDHPQVPKVRPSGP